MGTTAVIEASKEAGLAPGEGVRAAIEGPEQGALFEADGEAVSAQLLGRRPASRGGRKPGAKNRATKEIIQWVRDRYTDPLMWLGEVASMSLDELAEWLGGDGETTAILRSKSRMELAEFQRKVVVELKNTLYPGQTLAEALKDLMGPEGLQVIGFMAMARATGADVGAAPPDIHGGLSAAETRRRVPSKDQEYQQVSEDDGEPVAQTEGRTDDLSD